MGLKEDFLAVYSNLPLNSRNEIIYVLDKEPITWNAVFAEVLSDTPRAEKILKGLKELKLI